MYTCFIPGDEFKWVEKDPVIGAKTSKDLLQDEIIYKTDIEIA